eukprot:s1184_g27.t1
MEDVIPALPWGTGALRQHLLCKWFTLEQAVCHAELEDRLSYLELRSFIDNHLVGAEVQSSPEDVGFGLLSVPEDNELPVTSPSRMEAGILKLFMTLFKVEHGEEPTSSDATISKPLLLFELSRSAPREGFRSWSSKALLTDELSKIMDSHLSKEGFCELVVRSNGHVEDAKEWFDSLCSPNSPRAVLTPAALTQQALSWPRLPGALDSMDGWQPAELVVRLAALWGDLTAAFGLAQNAARDGGEEDATWPVSLRASKENVKSMARCDRSSSPPSPPPRKLRRLTMRQWLRALRGKPGRLLLGEMEARTESERLAALPQTVDRLFPNLCDRLLVTKNLWLPGELICVRYCLSDFGYWGSGGPEPLVAGRKLILGRQPFITFLPQPEVAGLEDAMPPSRAVLSQLPSGIVWLRAPVAPPKSGEIVAGTSAPPSAPSIAAASQRSEEPARSVASQAYTASSETRGSILAGFPGCPQRLLGLAEANLSSSKISAVHRARASVVGRPVGQSSAIRTSFVPQQI